MSEGKDPAIKLFGKTIPLPECHAPVMSAEKSDLGLLIPISSQVLDVCGETMKTETEDLLSEESGMQEKSDGKDNQITANETESQVNLKRKENLAETSSVDQDKVLKRPDKVLPCPRCNSFDTKFCYFNNYNVNQPRHFCKNCQRYWTAGGTMRNVPIGAGRRKNKQLAFQYRQMLVPPEPAPRIGISDSGSQQLFSSSESPSTLRPPASNGTVLKFGPEGHLSESMETVLQLGDQKNCVPELGSTRENGPEPPSGTSSIAENQIPEMGNFPGSSNELTQQNPLQFCSVPPWVFPCNQFWNNGASIMTAPCSSEASCVPDGSSANAIQWCSTPMLTVPGFSAPTIPLHFLPSSYWGCYPVWTTGTRNSPTVGSNGGFSPSSSSSLSSTVNTVSRTNSATLGKHLRDAKLMDEEMSEKCILVPKTLRIDDPDEASKSSIWAALGFDSSRKETKVSCGSGGALKPFKSGGECKGNTSDATQVLEANPAALSRSHTFQEST